MKDLKMSNKSLGIIIPLYKGGKYISYWLNIIKENIKKLKEEKIFWDIQLFFVNDCPEERLEIKKYKDYEFTVNLINLNENYGIHKSRIYGLSNVLTDYIIFMDQDDLITDKYLYSQISKIGAADFVVCNSYIEQYLSQGKILSYENLKTQQDALKLESFLSGNKIITTGVVMMKRNIIPKLWCTHTIKTNGADDFFLWLLLFKKKHTVAINESVLYTHTLSETNTSNNKYQMAKSVLEMCDILEKEKVFLPQELLAIRKKCNTKNIFAYQSMLFYKRMINFLGHGNSIKKEFEKMGIYSVALYDMTYIGDEVYNILNIEKMDVKYLISGNNTYAQNFYYTQKLYKKNELTKNMIRSVDAVLINSFAVDVNESEKFLKDIGFSRVISIYSIINGV